MARTHDAADYIGADARPITGGALVSTNPANPAEVVWSGSPRVEHVRDAIDAARDAQREWWALGEEKRIEALRAYQAIASERADELANLGADEL